MTVVLRKTRYKFEMKLKQLFTRVGEVKEDVTATIKAEPGNGENNVTMKPEV